MTFHPTPHFDVPGREFVGLAIDHREYLGRIVEDLLRKAPEFGFEFGFEFGIFLHPAIVIKT